MSPVSHYTVHDQLLTTILDINYVHFLPFQRDFIPQEELEEAFIYIIHKPIDFFHIDLRLSDLRSYGQWLETSKSANRNLQSWTLIFAQMRNVTKKCFSANVPKVLIFGLPVRTGTINDFSCKDWVLGSYWQSYMS